MTFPVSPKVWFRVDQIAGLSNGDPTPSTLTDQSGNGFTGSKVGSATYVTGATPNGTPVIRFATLGSGYTFATLAGMTAASAFIVLKRGARPINVGPWNLRAGDGSYFTYNDGNAYEGSFTDSGATRAVFAYSATDYHIFHVAVGGGTLSAYVDNVLKATAAYTTFTPPTSPCIGRTTINGTDQGWDGDIAEFVLFDTVLSGADRAAVVAELTARHLAATITPPAASATTTAVAPAVSAGASVSPPAATASAAARAPSVATTGSATVAAIAATTSAAALAPTVAADATIAAPAATGAATAPAPSVAATADATVLAVVATATATAPVAAITDGSGNRTVSPPAATATATALAPTITQIIPAGTDTSNSLNGRRRRARGSVVVVRPAAATPSRAAVKYDKSVPYPPPTLVNGRPT